MVRDVGSYYANTGRLAAVAWAWATDNDASPDLYKIDVGTPSSGRGECLHRQWKKYYEMGFKFLRQSVTDPKNLTGDNLEFHRTDGSDADATRRYQTLYAEVVNPSVGGDDQIRTGSGDKVVLGGLGDDRIETQTQTGDLDVVLGDAGSVVFDSTGNGQLSQIRSASLNAGGQDQIVVGAGTTYVVAGLGNDTITVNAADDERRLLVGDQGQIDFSAGLPIFVQSTSPDDDDLTRNVDQFILPSRGSQIVIGDKEMAADLVAVRTRGGEDLGQMTPADLIKRLLDEVAARSGTA
jgi:Ca2+-binding RTX toxin-like protein